MFQYLTTKIKNLNIFEDIIDDSIGSSNSSKSLNEIMEDEIEIDRAALYKIPKYLEKVKF